MNVNDTTSIAPATQIDRQLDKKTDKKFASTTARWFKAHSYLGMIMLIPLFVIIVTGTISFYLSELIPWHIPELRQPTPEPIQELDALIGDLVKQVPADATATRIDLPKPQYPLMKIRWWGGAEPEVTTHINTDTGHVLDPRLVDSHFAMQIYEWHYLHPLPQGLLIAGFISIVWITMVITGTWLHRRKILDQFFSWRQHAGRSDRPLRSWLHAGIATITIPLQVIYGVTGAFFGTVIIALPLLVYLQYGGSQDKLMADVFGQPASPEAETDQPSQLPMVVDFPALDPIVHATLAAIPDSRVTDIFIENPRQRSALVHVHVRNKRGEEGEALFAGYSHQSSQPLEPSYVVMPGDHSDGAAILGVVVDLHFGSIGGPIIKIIFFIGGVLMAIMTAMACRMWVLRNCRQQAIKATVVERLFDGFALGVIPAIAIFAWATRLLPWDIDHRGEIEAIIFHASWILIAGTILVIGSNGLRRRIVIWGGLTGASCLPFLDGFWYGTWPWQAQAWIIPSVAIINIFLLTLGCSIIIYFTWKWLRHRKISTIVSRSNNAQSI